MFVQVKWKRCIWMFFYSCKPIYLFTCFRFCLCLHYNARWTFSVSATYNFCYYTIQM